MRSKNFFRLLSGSFSGLCVGLLLSSSLLAQDSAIDPNAFGYYRDALRLSQQGLIGSARMQSVGGASTALGGDITSAYTNPAGLGLLTKSEVSFAPSLAFLGSRTEFQNEETSAFRPNLNFAHLGLAIHLPNSRKDSFYKGHAVAFNFTRLNTFHNRFSYEGSNNQNSLIDYLLESSRRFTWGDLDNEIKSNITSIEGLAYATYLINPDFINDNGSETTYYSFVPVSPVRQLETVDTRGAQNNWNLSYGGNFGDVLFIGGGVAMQTFSYSQSRTYTEKVTGGAIDNPSAPRMLNELTLEENLGLNGVGVNASLGLILRPLPLLRIGASFHSPTVTAVKETFDARLDVNYNNVEFEENGQVRTLGKESAETAIVESRYTLTTPWRANVGAAIFFGKRGFISADAEYVALNNANFTNRNDNISFGADNRTIENLYRPVVNYRLGAEARFENYYLRGGAAYFADPFNPDTREGADQSLKRDRLVLTGGLGYRDEEIYFDLGGSFGRSQFLYNPYTLTNNAQPTAKVNSGMFNLVASIGLHF
jgi:hypothetical protein